MSRVKLLVLVNVVLLLAGCTVPFAPQIIGSGTAETKDFDLVGFTAVAAGSAFEVEITRSGTYSVAVTVDENLVDYLDVGVSVDTLHIYLKPGIARSLKPGITHSAALRAKVTMPELTGLNLSGASRTTLTGFSSGKPLQAEVSGASTLRGDMVCGDARFDVSGASQVVPKGSAQNLNAETSGASTADFSDFTSKNTVVSASGASKVIVSATGSLDVEASGASTVRYAGEPVKLKVNTSGASSVGQK